MPPDSVDDGAGYPTHGLGVRADSTGARRLRLGHSRRLGRPESDTIATQPANRPAGTTRLSLGGIRKRPRRGAGTRTTAVDLVMPRARRRITRAVVVHALPTRVPAGRIRLDPAERPTQEAAPGSPDEPTPGGDQLAADLPSERPSPRLAHSPIEVAHRRPWPLGWPLWALTAGFPIWWALGLSMFVFPLAAVPMLVHLRRMRPIRLPPLFWIWGLFLVWLMFSTVMLPFDPSFTSPGSVSGRLISVSLSRIEYLAVTVTLIYVVNLPRSLVSRDKIVSWLGILFLVTTTGGWLGILVPTLSFTSPVELLVPHGLRSDPYIASVVHPSVSQLQNVLGDVSGRPSAPFGYTNTWGNCMGVLLPFFIAGWVCSRESRRRWIGTGVVVLSLVPIVYSLNRGLWIGLIVSAVWVAVVMFVRGRPSSIIVLAVAAGILVIGFFVTPLHTIVQGRLDNPNSNSIRAYLTANAVRVANESPVLGWGGPRKTTGSAQSIAIGRTASCPRCGGFSIGGNGQLWGLLITVGWGGAALFVGFFLASLWVYRRQRSPAAIAAQVVVVGGFVYMLFYNSVPPALTLTMIGIGLLARDHQPVQRGPVAESNLVPVGAPVRLLARR